MTKKYLFILYFVFICRICYSQNLVTNPDFEEYTNCPCCLGDITSCIGWSTTSMGSSPEYFNKCYVWDIYTDVKIGVPSNFQGYRMAHSGGAYAGLALFLNKNYKEREYIKNKLKSSLEKGKKYRVSFYISLADSSEYKSDHISFTFTSGPNSKIKLNVTRNDLMEDLLNSPTRIKIYSPSKLGSKEWVKVEGEYYSLGGEEYLIIGSFAEDMSKKEYKKILKNEIIPCNGNECAPYYYIDDVIVEEILRNSVVPEF